MPPWALALQPHSRRPAVSSPRAYGGGGPGALGTGGNIPRKCKQRHMTKRGDVGYEAWRRGWRAPDFLWCTFSKINNRQLQLCMQDATPRFPFANPFAGGPEGDARECTW